MVRIFGPELDVLQRKAAQVGKVMSGVPGAADVKVQALNPGAASRGRVRSRPGAADRGDAQQEQVPFGRELVIRGAEERLSPILMTALVTSLALVPIVLGGDRSGHEIEHPMAVVIIGGLVTSTALNLFLLPSIYLRYGRTHVHE